jgi:hypothetical protein
MAARKLLTLLRIGNRGRLGPVAIARRLRMSG